MICDRAVACLLAAYAAGADDAAVTRIGVALGVDLLDLSVWRMRARSAIDGAMRDWEILQDGIRWRQQLAAAAVQAQLSEAG